MAERVKITVNGNEMKAESGASLLKVLLDKGYDIPHLCYHESVAAYGACRLCIVEVEVKGRKKIATSCNHPVMADMSVALNTDEIMEQRRNLLETMLALAPDSKYVEEYAARYGVRETSLKLQEGECVLCGLCERVCTEVLGAGAICFSGRGGDKEITTPYAELSPTCIGCGSCARVCPTGCIKIVDKGLIRQIAFIHAEHELVPCSACGTATVTKLHAAWLAKKMQLPEEDFYVCDKCKARRTAHSYANLT